MDPIERLGWSNVGGSDKFRCYSPRQGRLWTDKEDYDLMQQIEWGVPIEWIAKFHQRSLGGILSRLSPERAEAGAARYAAGIPKPKPEKRLYSWNSIKVIKNVY